MISKTKTEEYLRAVSLPENTKSYTRIPHGFIIDQMRESIERENLEIEYELYKGSSAGEEALGFIQIKSTLDPEMGMTFNWTNSYNKKLKFGCSVGAFIYDLKVPFIYADNTITWSRKHTGTANTETAIVVEEMISHSEEHFKNIVKMKKAFTAVKLTDEEMAAVLGEMFFAKDYFGPEQANLVKAELKKPKYDYKHKQTLWHLHQMLMVSIVDSDPTKWYSQQIKINTYLTLKYNIDISNQVIDEVEEGFVPYFTDERIEVIKEESFTVKEHLPEFKQHPEIQAMLSEIEAVEEIKEEIIEFKEEEVTEDLVFEEEEQPTFFEETEEIVEEEKETLPTCPECGSKDITITLGGNIECNYCESLSHVDDLNQESEAVTDDSFELEEEEEEEVSQLKSMSQYRELITDFFNPESLYAVDDRAREDGYIVLVMKTGETLVL